jgi:hypothetical protein
MSKRAVVTKKKTIQQDDNSDSEYDSTDELVTSELKTHNSKKSNSLKVEIIHDENINETLKSLGPYIAPLVKTVESLKELLSGKLDEMVTNYNKKQKEYIELIEQKEKEYKNKTEQLEKEFKDKDVELNEVFKTKNTELLQKYKYDKIDLEQKIKNEKIEAEQEIRKYKLEACEKISSDNDYKLVPLKEYENMDSECKELKERNGELESNMQDKIKERIEIEKQIFDDKEKQSNLTNELNHKAEIAELTAQNKQQIKEIEMLNKIIVNLTNEVSEQRILTKEIAIATSYKPQITQSASKDRE